MQSTKDRIVTHHGDWFAVYHGGAYIDIHHFGNPEAAVTCINVYDYAEGAPTIPFERGAVRGRFLEWFKPDEDGWRELDDIVEHVLPYQ
jgi:hypothetical protein